MLLLLFFDDSLETTVSGVEIAGLCSLIENVVQSGALDCPDEISGLGGGAIGSVLLEKLPCLEPLAMVLGLNDSAFSGW